jgi:hypothetical protein
LRLKIYIKNLKEYYYDVGLRKNNIKLPDRHWQYGRKVPRFLEDWIEEVGKNNIEVHELGSLSDEISYIRKLGVKIRGG